MVLVFNYVKYFWEKPLFFDEKLCLKFKGKIVEKLMVLWYNIEV